MVGTTGQRPPRSRSWTFLQVAGIMMAIYLGTFVVSRPRFSSTVTHLGVWVLGGVSTWVRIYQVSFLPFFILWASFCPHIPLHIRIVTNDSSTSPRFEYDPPQFSPPGKPGAPPSLVPLLRSVVADVDDAGRLFTDFLREQDMYYDSMMSPPGPAHDTVVDSSRSLPSRPAGKGKRGMSRGGMSGSHAGRDMSAASSTPSSSLERSFREYLTAEANRAPRRIERTLDWVLHTYRFAMPFAILALVLRLAGSGGGEEGVAT